MKRKTLIVLLVLLLVGILAFTVFACNNNKPDPDPDKPDGNGPGPDDDDDDDEEEETYAIVEALPKLVTGLDKVAATVGDIDEGKAAYLGADIGLNFGVTADGLDVAADLVLSLKVSVDEAKAANNWALIGLKSDNKDVAQLFLTVEDGAEKIYIKEALTGNNNWKLLSVLDTTANSNLEGLFTGGNYGLIDKLFSLVSGLTAEDSTFPIDFGSDSPIGGLEIMEGSKLNQLVGTIGLLGEAVDGALHAEAYDNGNRYVATLNREGIGELIGGLTETFELGDLLTTLEKLNPVLELVLGMKVEDGKFIVNEYADPDDAPVLDIEFSIDPESAALTDLSIDFANGDIEGMGIKLGLALSNIELSNKSKAPETETAGVEDLGINLDLEAKLPAWPEAATIAVSVDPKAVIGWNAKDGSIEIDLSAVQGHATFNNALIAEYTTNGDQKGFAITLKPVYEFIAKDQTGDLRDQVYFIPCDLAAIVTAALNPTTDAGTETIQNAALADEIELSGTLGTLIDAIKALSQPGADILGGIGNIIGPALTNSNSIVKLLLAEITTGDAITFDPELGEDVTTSASVTVKASALVEFAMGENLLGGAGFDKLLNIQLYDFSAARAITAESAAEDVTAANTKKALTLDGIFAGDIIEVALDLIYTAMYEGAQKDTTEPYTGTFVEFAQDQVVDDEFILAVATAWGIDEITDDGKLNVDEIGNITASINLGNGIHVTLEALGAYVSLGADLDSYVAPTGEITGDFKVITSWNDFNADGGLQNALMELAGYALGVEVAA